MPPGCSSVLQALGLQRSWLSSSLEPVCRNQHALGLGRSASRNRVVWGCFFEKPWEGLCSDDMSRDSDGVRLGEILSVLVAQSCLTLCDPMSYSLARPLLPGLFCLAWILQARILEWVAIPFSRGSSRDQIRISCLTGGFFTI